MTFKVGDPNPGLMFDRTAGSHSLAAAGQRWRESCRVTNVDASLSSGDADIPFAALAVPISGLGQGAVG